MYVRACMYVYYHDCVHYSDIITIVCTINSDSCDYVCGSDHLNILYCVTVVEENNDRMALAFIVRLPFMSSLHGACKVRMSLCLC